MKPIVLTEKEAIRRMMMRRRGELTPLEVRLRSARLVNEILAHPSFKRAQLVALYHPLGNEVDLRLLMQARKRFALPKVVGSELHFIEVTEDTKFEKSSFGIMEPVAGPYVDGEIDLLLVPTLAIDKNNYRIGFGKGYYDRFLTKRRPHQVMAVIYDFQLIPDAHHEAHDVALDGHFIA